MLHAARIASCRLARHAKLLHHETLKQRPPVSKLSENAFPRPRQRDLTSAPLDHTHPGQASKHLHDGRLADFERRRQLRYVRVSVPIFPVADHLDVRLLLDRNHAAIWFLTGHSEDVRTP